MKFPDCGFQIDLTLGLALMVSEIYLQYGDGFRDIQM